MLKASILLLFSLFASSEIVLASPSHAECSAALYKGLSEGFLGMQRQVMRLMEEGKIDRHIRPTCEFLSMLRGVVFRRFHDSKCKIGSDGASTVLFEKRFFSLLGGLMEEDCQAFSTEIGDDSSMCTPREELFTALNKTYTCMVRVARDVYEANGITNYGRVQDLCVDLENFGPCFEGMVDDCHDDGGKTSESILDALAAIVAFVTTEVYPTEKVMDQLGTCFQEAENPNWLLSRLAGIPLSQETSSIPDYTVIEALNEGTQINFSEDAYNQFSMDIYTMMAAINEREGMNH